LRILLINAPHPILKTSLEAHGHQIEEDFTSTIEELVTKIHFYDGIVMRSRVNATKELIDAGTRLKFIAREGVGLEHIEVAYAQSKGIEVIISPEGSKDIVGEQAIAMLLSLTNKLTQANTQVKSGQWLREPNRSIEIKGKTIGIIGYGNMGQAFAQKISGFGCKVYAYDQFKINYGNQYALAVTLEKIQAEADIITLHIPYSIANHHFINDGFFEACKKPIIIINTARGLVLETAALVKALKSGQAIGAGLDVIEYEDQSFSDFSLDNLPADWDYLTQSPHVILTPHVAGWSFESKEKHGIVLAEKILKLVGKK